MKKSISTPVRSNLKARPINKRAGRLVCICERNGRIVYLADDYRRSYERS